ncbi:hypothetical protein Goshw_017473 [Gossypium schwendimanii]|uniref:Uncharacterized protein n=1 Tax=Gossypium schwendimanii TaxID=34291 RepID=A0A7J9MK86_GOSSC|nr:hypothetical protein [Gossypium schwendimanii]
MLARKSKIKVDPPYTLALKAESKLAGKEREYGIDGKGGNDKGAVMHIWDRGGQEVE